MIVFFFPMGQPYAPTTSYIYIYISASLWSSRFSYVDVDVRMRGWGFLQNMHSDIGLAFAVIRGVGTQQQKSLGGKGPNQLVDERLRGRQFGAIFQGQFVKTFETKIYGNLQWDPDEVDRDDFLRLGPIHRGNWFTPYKKTWMSSGPPCHRNAARPMQSVSSITCGRRGQIFQRCKDGEGKHWSKWGGVEYHF